jgi:hypothetical protein
MTQILLTPSYFAELFGHAFKSDQEAGVWMSVPTQQLRSRTLPYLEGMKRSAKWRAPSWSYVSVDGPFRFQDLKDGEIRI